MSDHIIERMEEREFDELDIKCALMYGKSFASVEDKDATLTIFVIDEADYEGQMTNYGTRATHFILVHKKNKFGAGRELLTGYYADCNCLKVRYNMGK
ncbi:hypothetical protein N184_32700 [Sinorhizobium sp. GL28]|nr:hypothetical protein N184_32700 [Sinorhizobium sp. GL28]